MPNVSPFCILIMAVLITTCSGNKPSGPAQLAVLDTETGDLFETARSKSCPEEESLLPAQRIEINAAPVTAENNKDWEGALGNAAIAGIWHLTSPEPNFGGLSGLAVESSGDLLAVTDQGAFVSISLQDGAPNGEGSIGYMRGSNGQPLSGKDTSDSEGLHLQNGLALVSFERDHRISAFDLAGCGIAAREVLLMQVPTKRSANQGLEALTMAGGDLLAGWEKTARSQARLQRYSVNPAGDIGPLDINAPGGLSLTGMDALGNQSFAVFRAYSPILGNAIEVRKYTDLSGDGEMVVRLQRPLPVDNFEGIAATQLDDTTLRIYIIADNNFSARQRTLLMTLDVPAP